MLNQLFSNAPHPSFIIIPAIMIVMAFIFICFLVVSVSSVVLKIREVKNQGTISKIAGDLKKDELLLKLFTQQGSSDASGDPVDMLLRHKVAQTMSQPQPSKALNTGRIRDLALTIAAIGVIITVLF
ncbi:hypothetical protein ACFYKX_11800 [Cytobacillus sp. FJAT-54145]|uniref:Uncharacterized protein n=1 Tax=Cytobacillus spartinae TaxID=3299023 RepID=A0ABW6KEF2_9BACI